MGWLLAILFVAAVVGYLAWRDSDPAEDSYDPAEIVRFQIERHRIRRRLEVGLTKTEQRRSAECLKRKLSETLDEDS